MKGDDEETCFSLDPKTGQTRWSRGIDQTIHDREGGDGPRSTPTFIDGKVYVLGTYLKLACLDATDGKILWMHDLVKEFTGAKLGWGNAASPLVEGNLVFVCAGGKGQALMAFDKDTGNVVWKTQDDKPTHATPVPASLLGVRQIIFFTQKGLVSVKPETGQVLWRAAVPLQRLDRRVAGRLRRRHRLLHGRLRLRVRSLQNHPHRRSFTSTEMWHKHGNKVINQWSTPVYKDGYLYGLYGFKEFNTEPLKCIEVKTGKEKWSPRGLRPGPGHHGRRQPARAGRPGPARAGQGVARWIPGNQPMPAADREQVLDRARPRQRPPVRPQPTRWRTSEVSVK